MQGGRFTLLYVEPGKPMRESEVMGRTEACRTLMAWFAEDVTRRSDVIVRCLDTGKLLKTVIDFVELKV